MLIDAPQAASWATDALQPLGNFFGTIVAKAQAAFQSDSDALIEFFNDMLVMDIHNNFWDHWDADFMYSTDYDFVVPLQEDHRVCKKYSSDQGSGADKGIEDASDRVMGKRQYIHGDAHRRQGGGKHRGQTAAELIGEQSLRGNK